MYDPDYEGQELIDPVPGEVEGYITARELGHTMALYAGEITFLDKWVGLLLDRVRELGLWDNTLLSSRLTTANRSASTDTSARRGPITSRSWYTFPGSSVTRMGSASGGGSTRWSRRPT